MSMEQAINNSLQRDLGWSEPATVEQFLVKQLVANMLWPKEAVAVVAKMIAEDETGVRFDSRLGESGYPKQMLAILTLTAKRVAVDWIDENKPMHFARPLLAGEL